MSFVKEQFRNKLQFCLEIFESAANHFENRTASIAFLCADRKRKNDAAYGSKNDDKIGTYFANVPNNSFVLGGALTLLLSSAGTVYAQPDKNIVKADLNIASSVGRLISFTEGTKGERLECKQEIKEPSATLGVWGYLNKFYQSKIQPSPIPDSSSSKLPLREIPTDLLKDQQVKSINRTEPNPNIESIKQPIAPLEVIQKANVSLGKIVAHKAQYIITLEKNFGDDDISDAVGEMTIRVFDTGDGYVFEQNSSMIIYNTDGEGEQIITNLATWQDYQGNRYRFNARTLRNGEQEDIIKGEALKDPITQTAHVTYQFPTPSEITIPYESIFPLHHLLNAIGIAKNDPCQKGIMSNTVFDGSSETYEAVSVDTLLGDLTPSYLTIKTGDPEIDNSVKQQWPMRLSVYPIGSRTLDPDYSMDQNVLSCGIIKDMTLDYGSFQLKATLDTDKVMLYDDKAPKF